MANDKVMNRWLVVVGALLIQLCLGAIYAWSVFTTKLKDPAGQFAFTATQTQIIFSVGLGMFAALMPFAGKLQAKIKPRPVALMGGLILGLGYILAGFIGKTFATQLLTIGVLGGAGIGLAYVCPIAVGMRWFPDKKGLITGIAVAGFGSGRSCGCSSPARGGISSIRSASCARLCTTASRSPRSFRSAQYSWSIRRKGGALGVGIPRRRRRAANPPSLPSRCARARC